MLPPRALPAAHFDRNKTHAISGTGHQIARRPASIPTTLSNVYSMRMRITNCHDPLFETHRRNARLGLFYFFGFAACFAAAIARPFCFVAAAFACFCAACFWVAFGDLSPISLSYHPWFQELKNSAHQKQRNKEDPTKDPKLPKRNYQFVV
jgi:hypothetical protein